MVEMGPNVGWKWVKDGSKMGSKWGNRVQPSGAFSDGCFAGSLGELLGDTASGCHHSWTFLDHHFAIPRSECAMC